MDILKRVNALPEPERITFATNYREQVLRALGIAQTYDGSETKYQELTGTLIALETWLKDSLHVTSDKRISHRDERKLSSEIFNGTQHVAIDDVLRLSAKRLKLILQGAFIDSLEDLLNFLNIPSVRLPGVIFPPGEQKIPEGSGEGNGERFETKFQQRFSQFVAMLQRQGIFTDDIVVCHGNVSEKLMRQISYYIVEIPRLNKQILLCDQVGEATFVIQGRLSQEILMATTKEQLQEKYPERITRVVYTSSEAWEEQLSALLFADGVGAKVDVRDQEALRGEILKLVPTAEEWAEVKKRERIKFKVAGMGFVAIATRFGVNGNPTGNNSDYLELGRKIYGECEVLKEISLENLRLAIAQKIPTAKEWAEMKNRKRTKFKVLGIGPNAIATRFGIEGNPIANYNCHRALGREIYGECKELEEISLDTLKAEILAQVPTAEEWAAMNYKTKPAFRALGMGLDAIRTRFGSEGNPIGIHNDHLRLGRKIYGECKELEEFSLDTLKAEILAQVPTAEEWAAMKTKDTEKFKAGGMTLVRIAIKFGVEGKAISNRQYFLTLGRKIYGECKELEEISLDTLKAEILAQVPTAEEWAAMNYEEKKTFKACELGITAIATKLGVKGGPFIQHTNHLKVGRAIYGENPALME